MIQLVLIFCAFASTVLGIIVLLHDAKKLFNFLAAGINFCIAAWSLAILLFMDANNPELIQVYAQAYYAAAAIFAALFFMFSEIFPDNRSISSTKRLVAIGAMTAMLICIFFVPGFLIDTPKESDGGNYIVVDTLSYIVYSTYFGALFLYALQTIAKKFLQSKKSLRAQTGIYLAGILVMCIPGFVTNLFLPFYGVYSFIWVAPAMGVIFLGLVSYGIVRHGLFDLRMAAVRSTAYLLSFGTLAFLYYVLVSTTSYVLLQQTIAADKLLIGTALAMGVSLAFQPVKHFFDKATSSIFYRNSYINDDFFSKLNDLLVRNTDLKSMLQQTCSYIESTLHAKQVYFYIFRVENDKRDMIVSAPGGVKIAKQDVLEINRYMRDTKSSIIATNFLEVSDNHIRRVLRSNKIEVAVPLMRSDVAVGYLFVGESRGQSFTARDIRVLRTISDELVIAIQNALAVQQVRDLNDSLQQRIDDATKELRRTNAQLQRLDEAKDEFVSMASHQLRTPLTSVKGYIDMVLQGDAGKITDMQKHLLSEAFTSSERMVHLINDFLNVSRLQTGKFIIEKAKTDMQKLVQQEVESLAVSATQRQLSFELDIDTRTPLLMIDEGKMRQVVMNFLDNSLYYSRAESKIHVQLCVKGGDLEFTVKDTGIGVPEKEQAHLFTKFYRASNARKQRPDGTGVGLFLAKKVVMAHGGRMIFTSNEGKGSTFGFSLPIKRLLAADRSQKASD